ncbi:hypothetical protein TNCV_991531 [Trichonephila clavipes]|nr:hypothetical protein TNCV_991531 [Trichonephila clavipes]
MRARNYYAHPNIRDHWALRCMNRCSDMVVCLTRGLQRLRPQASLVLIYRPNVAGMKGRVDLSQTVNRTQDLWCGNTIHYHSTLFGETKPIDQLTSPLPSDRINQTPALSVCGLYFAGPLRQ